MKYVPFVALSVGSTFEFANMTWLKIEPNSLGYNARLLGRPFGNDAHFIARFEKGAGVWKYE